MEKKMHCPRCSGLISKRFMRKIRHASGAILDVCDNCHGMWLDGGEVKLLYDFSSKQNSFKKNKKLKNSRTNLSS